MKCDQDILQNPAGPRKRASSTSEQPSRVAVRSQRSRLVGWLVDRRDEVVEDGGGGDSCDDGAVLLGLGWYFLSMFRSKKYKSCTTGKLVEAMLL